ncbi:hypothetical protein G6F31_015324 [Rhizopus arrhizus]|nr:hypothetical protein G6F31_015324 [Rhizopus arrhizus]
MADQALGRGAGSEVDHDDAAGAAQRRVGHVGHALATDTEIEAHIVDVGARVDDVDREHQRSGHGIGGQIDRHQLGAAGLWCRDPGRGGVQHPQPTLAIGHHTLHADEVGRRIGTVLAVDARIRIGHGAAVAPFGHAVRHLIAPAREVDKDPPGLGHRHAGGHGALETRHRLDDADAAIAGQHRRSCQRQRQRGGTGQGQHGSRQAADTAVDHGCSRCRSGCSPGVGASSAAHLASGRRCNGESSSLQE